MQQRIVHLFCFLIMWFLLKCVNKKETRLGRALAGFAAALSAVIGVYFVAQAAPMVLLQKGIWGISTLDMIAGIFLVLLILEVSRQAVGLALPIIAMIFILFALAGPILPPIIAHKGYDISYITSYVAWTSEGIFGTPIGAATSFVVLYIIFGEMLDQFGAGQFFIDIAYALTGRIARRAGGGLCCFPARSWARLTGARWQMWSPRGLLPIPLMKKSRL